MFNNRYAFLNYDVRKTFTVTKCTPTNTGHTAGNGDGVKSLTSSECAIGNFGHTAVRRNDTVVASGDQCFGCCFDQAISAAVIHRVGRVNRDALQFFAPSERLLSNLFHAARNG